MTIFWQQQQFKVYHCNVILLSKLHFGLRNSSKDVSKTYLDEHCNFFTATYSLLALKAVISSESYF